MNNILNENATFKTQGYSCQWKVHLYNIYMLIVHIIVHTDR